MSDYIDGIFGPHGLMSKAFEGYEPRSGQIALARMVDRAIADRRHLVAEAPCGIGKSYAYCVPAIRHATQNGRKVVVATANIALQEQLHTKDIPALAGLLPWPFKHSLVKGRSNYLCVSKWQDEQAGSSLKSRRSKMDRDQYRRILSWARRTATGDMSELDFAPQPGVWHLFSSTADECKGQDCGSRFDCFAERAREEAAGSHILVTNYHLLFAHLQVRMMTGKDLILPEFDVVVCDEAHKAADIARDFFGFRIAEGSVRFASRLLGRLGMSEEYDAIDSLSIEFFHDLRRFRKSGAYRTRFRSPSPIRSWQPLKDALLDIRAKFLSQAFGLVDAGRADEKAALMRASATAGKIAGNLESAMTVADPEMVYFIEEGQGGSVALMGKPIFVAPVLASELFAKVRSVVATSATLAVGGSFSHTIGELGMPDPMTLAVDSPFDFGRQAIMVIPEGMPDPVGDGFPKAVAEAVERTIGFADGRTLCLFTSYRNLEEAWNRVSADPRHRILKQGDKPRIALIDEFRSDIHSVLLGTESFWAGVDVPGEALSCVVMDRLPFQTPDDPVLNAISERDEDWFMSHSVPKAVMAFKQGFGRLIRRATDRGVVVVLDRRIVTKPYGRKFLLSIPDVRKSKRLESVRVFLDKDA
jgi:ATP-dependent DNA helicase DinG